MAPADQRRHAPATARNRAPLLAVLQQALPDHGTVLEIAAGTGEHAAHCLPQLPGLCWLATDVAADNLASIDAWRADCADPRWLAPLALDVTAAVWPVETVPPKPPISAMLCVNMIHIAPWTAAAGLFAGAGRVLPPGAPLLLYGPFKRQGVHSAPSNADFDGWLKAQDPSYGVRDLEDEVVPCANRHGLTLADVTPMPANNFTLRFTRQ